LLERGIGVGVALLEREFWLEFLFLVSLGGGEDGGGGERGVEGVGSGEWEVGNGGLGDGMGVSEERARMVSMVDFDSHCIK